jgi:hypothetical protein
LAADPLGSSVVLALYNASIPILSVSDTHKSPMAVQVLVAFLAKSNTLYPSTMGLKLVLAGVTVMVPSRACSQLYVSAKPISWLLHRYRDYLVPSKGIVTHV